MPHKASTTTFDRVAIARRGRRLEYFTVGWNSLEGLVAIGAGALAGSISLVGFGIDSFIEVTSGAALLWRMAGDADVRQRERREAVTLRIVGWCFLALATYVCIEAVSDLFTGSRSQPSTIGVALAAVSLAVMPLLSHAKRKVARSLGSAAMHADATQTDFCAYLSAILLGGLLINLLLGWWWADPLAALLMAPLMAREGLAALRGDTCCE
jgi:divalent metal cation (Fe/Co/Zn/Cd) transporter